MSDPIVDEVRAVRKKLSERFNNDVTAIMNHLRELHVKEMARRQRKKRPESARKPKKRPVAKTPAQSVS